MGGGGFLGRRFDALGPPFLRQGDSVLHGAWVHVELCADRDEEATAGEDAAFEVGDELLAERVQAFERIRNRLRRLDDLGFEDDARRVHRRELELLLRAEMGVEATLAHTDVRGKVADGEALETVDRGEVGGRAEDRVAAPLAVGASLPCGGGRHA